MSRIQSNYNIRSNGVVPSVENTLSQKLEPWVNNPPDYKMMVETYKQYGRLKATITRKKREIERAEEQVTIEVDRPRSNEAKVAKLNATSTLKDELTEIEAELAECEADVKALEFMKSMFASSNFRMHLQEQYV